MPFMPGVSGNPRGRPRNRGASGKLRAAIEKQAPALVNALVKQALAGDTPAAIALLARACPPLKPVDVQAEPLSIPTLAAAPSALLAALSAGTLTVSQVSELANALANLARVSETVELEARIAALEGKARG